jgi:hypothetical protein
MDYQESIFFFHFTIPVEAETVDQCTIYIEANILKRLFDQTGDDSCQKRTTQFEAGIGIDLY